MANERLDILFPVGRLVGGDPYTLKDTDSEGKPRVIMTGPNAGKAKAECYLAVAIPKIAGHTHWGQTDWGAKIYASATAAWPSGQYQTPTFAWKIVDGDSAIPNRNGTVPNKREGYPGHWVVSFTGSFLPPIYNADGSQRIETPGAVKTGYYVQVFGNIASNESSKSPGIYMNYSMIALAGYGPEITYGPDASAVGFGGALPPGASAVPVTSFAPPAAAPPTFVPTSHPANATAAPVTPTAITPAPSFLTPQAPPVAAPPKRVLKNGWDYAEAIKMGWTDATLIQAGYL